MRDLLAEDDSKLAENKLQLAHSLKQLVAELETEPLEPTAGAGISTDENPEIEVQPQKKLKKAGKGRTLDFAKYRLRYVALEVMYIGWAYQGFARQDNTENTIEGHFFSALRKVKLIPEEAEISSLQYSRCGRTDKGVSALGQVLALKLRSVARTDQEEAALDREYDYPIIINRALPPDIRVLAWCPLHPEFSARFSATYRLYRYFIVQRGQLDVAKMRDAAARLCGRHDFRNFCKLDVLAVKSFERVVYEASITQLGLTCHGGEVLVFTVKGSAFLWHQVRCMVAVLLMVGQGQEAPEVVSQLLDVAALPCKPQYCMAPEEPLLLAECGYPEGALVWRRSSKVLGDSREDVHALLARQLVGAALVDTCLGRLMHNTVSCSSAPGETAARTPSHVLLMRRAREPSVEQRLRRHGITLAPSSLTQDSHQQTVVTVPPSTTVPQLDQDITMDQDGEGELEEEAPARVMQAASC